MWPVCCLVAQLLTFHPASVVTGGTPRMLRFLVRDAHYTDPPPVSHAPPGFCFSSFPAGCFGLLISTPFNELTEPPPDNARALTIYPFLLMESVRRGISPPLLFHLLFLSSRVCGPPIRCGTGSCFRTVFYWWGRFFSLTLPRPPYVAHFFQGSPRSFVSWPG